MRREQLDYIILSNNKDENRFKPIYRSKPSFQRPKKDLIQQILASHRQKCKPQQKEQQQFSNSYVPIRLISNGKRANNFQQISQRLQLQQSLSIDKISSDESNIRLIHLNDYFRDSKKSPIVEYQLIQSASISREKYQIIDRFIKNQGKTSINVMGIAPRMHCEQNRHQQKGNIFQSNRTQNQSTMVLSQFYRSKHASKIRRTEIFPNKTQARSQSASKVQYARDASSTKHQISKFEDHEIRNESSKAHILSRPYQIFHIASRQEQSQSQQPSKAYNKKNYSIAKSHLYQEKLDKSPARNFFMNDEKELKPSWDPEQQNLFDKMNNKEVGQQFKDIKQIFRIKNQQAFKNQIASEDEVFHRKKIKVINKKKERQQLFQGNQQKNLIKFVQQSSKQSDKKEKNYKECLKDQSIVDKIQLFQTIPKQQIKVRVEEPKIKEDKIAGNKRAACNLQQISMKAELSEHESSNSFLSKHQVNQQGIMRINDIVSQSIKAVNLNLGKVQAFRSNFITLLQAQKSSKRHAQQLKSQKKSINPIQSIAFQKIFGDISKEQKQQNIRIKKGVNHGGSFESQLSSVRKISEQKSQDKSMRKQLQDLNSSLVGKQYSQQKQIITLSQDALSFSKFADITNKHQLTPELILKSSSYIPSKQQHPIQQDHSLDKQPQSDDQINLQELQDYESDNQDHAQIKKKVLEPVIEQDLEETLFKKNKASKTSSFLQANKKQEKDNMKKKESEQIYSNTQKSSSFYKISHSISNKMPISKDEVSLSNVLLQKKESLVEQYKSSSLSDEKELMDSIKQDLSNLRSKIQSSFISNSEGASLRKEISQLSFKSEKEQIKSRNNLPNFNEQNSSNHFSNEKLFSKDKRTISKGNNEISQNQGDQSLINFDKINQEYETQYFNQFKQDFNRLKKKMLLDAGII